MKNLSKKQQTLLWLEKAPKALFQCIHCQSELYVINNGSLKCQNNHTFNLAKQGYYFLSKVSGDDSYSAELFKARRRIITESEFYTSLHNALQPFLKSARVVLDAGSGEGSHLADLLTKNQLGLAFDLSKSGVQLATDYNLKQFNAVADLTHLPLQDQSVDIILSILSPSNYEEFKRVGKRLIKVIPNSGYLKEIRQIIQQKGWLHLTDYSNEEVLKVFNSHIKEYETFTVTETVSLTKEQLVDIVQMTPLTWQLSKDQQDQLAEVLLTKKVMTLDVTILITA